MASQQTLAGKVCVVTGGASGIGAALCRRFAELGAKKVIVGDLSEADAQAVAKPIKGLGIRCNVASEMDVRRLIREVEFTVGPIDVFASNAGIPSNGGYDVTNDEWQRILDVNVLSHVYVARHLFPLWQQRSGEKHFIITASAAGLLTQAVQSGMTPEGAGGVAGGNGVLPAEKVAEDVTDAMAAKKFMVLPHPEVRKFFQNKANDYDRWIQGMGKLQKAFGKVMVRAPNASAAKL